MALLQDVDEIVASLRELGSIDGIVVFGSHARRDVRQSSDLDLLLVYRPSAFPRQIKKDVRKKIPAARHEVSVVFYTAEDLLKELDKRPSFAAHLSDEAIFLHCMDSCWSIKARLEGYVPDADKLARELRHEIRSLELFRDTSRFNGQFVSSLARLYSIARSVVIIRLLQCGVHEFRWRRIFVRYAELRPDLASSLLYLASLRPYYEYLIERRDTLHDVLGGGTAEASAATVVASIEAISAVASN